MKRWIIASLLTLLCLVGTALAQTAPNNYADDESWLCRPGHHDACDVDLTATVIAADGKLSNQTRLRKRHFIRFNAGGALVARIVNAPSTESPDSQPHGV